MTNWLDEREMQAWRGLLHLHEVTFAELERATKGHGVTLVEYGILAYLSEQPDGTMVASDLAEIGFVSRSRLSHRLTGLEQRGLVERVPCPADGRSVHVVLLTAGREFLEAIAPEHVEDVRRLFIDRLTSDQVDQLAEIMIAIHGRDVATFHPAG